LRGVVISEETGGVNDESGRSVAKNGRAAEESFAAIHAVELLDDDFLLSDERASTISAALRSASR
jgi:hypothetical protein